MPDPQPQPEWILEVSVRRQGQPPGDNSHGTTATAPDPNDKDANARTNDYATVRWNGAVYSLTRMQRRIIAHLWQAHEDGVPCVDQQTLLEVAESASNRLSGVFRDSPAWGTLIVNGADHDGAVGTYRLAPVPKPAFHR